MESLFTELNNAEQQTLSGGFYLDNNNWDCYRFYNSRDRRYYWECYPEGEYYHNSDYNSNSYSSTSGGGGGYSGGGGY